MTGKTFGGAKFVAVVAVVSLVTSVNEGLYIGAGRDKSAPTDDPFHLFMRIIGPFRAGFHWK